MYLWRYIIKNKTVYIEQGNCPTAASRTASILFLIPLSSIKYTERGTTKARAPAPAPEKHR
jgi:hypothetical protein